jgi:hypothetical protein
MLPAGIFPFSIAGKDLWTDVKLPRQKLNRAEFGLNRAEGSQKAGGCELKRNPQPVMPSPSLVNESKVSLIKMKIPRQLHVIGFCNIATVVLFCSWSENHRHIGILSDGYILTFSQPSEIL